MKTMRDSQGNDIPAKYVNGYDKARDAAAWKILARFRRARRDLEKLVVDCLADLDAVRAAAVDGKAGGDKGNYRITSFDGLIAVEIRQNYVIRLDERVVRARELMFEYASGLAGKVEGMDGAALLEIIKGAFESNRAGALPYTKVVGLLRYNITAPKWVEAKELLAASIRTEKGKCYLSCEERPDTQHDFRNIRLDLADCWPVEAK